MTAAVSFDEVSQRFGRFTALDHVSVDIERDTICGLLGRNGAGKTTMLRILTGHVVPSAGRARVFGEDPFENEDVLTQVCFVSENQRYPDAYRVHHVFDAARALFPNWDSGLAESLLTDFPLPSRRPVKKLSRGMRSWLGVVVGLASRAPLTLFDEPYLGMDAVARQLFYDRLLADYASHPRTVVLSTHLIDEVSDLVERVVLVDAGRIILDETAEDLRRRAVTVTGSASAVNEFAGRFDILHREQLGGVARATVRTGSDPRVPADAQAQGLTVEPVSLQQLMVYETNRTRPAGPTVATDSLDTADPISTEVAR